MEPEPQAILRAWAAMLHVHTALVLACAPSERLGQWFGPSTGPRAEKVPRSGA